MKPRAGGMRAKAMDFNALYAEYVKRHPNTRLEQDKFRRAAILLSASDYTQKTIREMLGINSKTLQRVNAVSNGRSAKEDREISAGARKNTPIPHKISEAEFRERIRVIYSWLKQLGASKRAVSYLVHTRRATPEIIMQRLRRMVEAKAPKKGVVLALSLSEPRFEARLGKYRKEAEAGNNGRRRVKKVPLVLPDFEAHKRVEIEKPKPIVFNEALRERRIKKPELYDTGNYSHFSAEAIMERVWRQGSDFGKMIEAGKNANNRKSDASILQIARLIREHYGESPIPEKKAPGGRAIRRSAFATKGDRF